PEAKIAVVPNAVDPDAFAPAARDAALAEELGIAPDEIVLGYVSTLSRYEGVRFLLEALGRLRGRGVRARVLVVGDGEDRAALEERARALGLGAAAVFTGRVPHREIVRYYSMIDVFVVPRSA